MFYTFDEDNTKKQVSRTGLLLNLLSPISILMLALFCHTSALAKTAPSKTSLFSDSDLNRKIGEAIFDKIWVFAPSSTKSSDGLGPLYNARSCKQCHDLSKQNDDAIPNSLVIQLSIETEESSVINKQYADQKYKIGFIPEPTYGKQIQTFAYPSAKAEARISVINETFKVLYPDNEEIWLTKPTYQFSELTYGTFNKDLRFSPRIAPRIHSLSLIDSFNDKQILDAADPNDRDKNGISGKANRVWDPISQTQKIGRFGWKAAKASLEQQNLAALATDIGISSWLFPKPEGDCTAIQNHCTDLAKRTETHIPLKENEQSQNDKFEASKTMTDLLLQFTKQLNHPREKNGNKPSNPAIQTGEIVFNNIQCHLCHSNHLVLGNSGTKSVNIGTRDLIYSDLLLHDMGDELTDNRQEFSASGNEWRTAPLLGISDYLKQSKNPRFLHDGRARTIAEAIIWHGGEAETSKQNFMALAKRERQALIEFIESL